MHTSHRDQWHRPSGRIVPCRKGGGLEATGWPPHLATRSPLACHGAVASPELLSPCLREVAPPSGEQPPRRWLAHWPSRTVASLLSGPGPLASFTCDEGPPESQMSNGRDVAFERSAFHSVVLSCKRILLLSSCVYVKMLCDAYHAAIRRNSDASPPPFVCMPTLGTASRIIVDLATHGLSS